MNNKFQIKTPTILLACLVLTLLFQCNSSPVDPVGKWYIFIMKENLTEEQKEKVSLRLNTFTIEFDKEKNVSLNTKGGTSNGKYRIENDTIPGNFVGKGDFKAIIAEPLLYVGAQGQIFVFSKEPYDFNKKYNVDRDKVRSDLKFLRTTWKLD